MAEVKNQSLDAGDKSEANSAASWLPAITDQERSLATQATNEFNRSNYDACLNLMNKLAATRGSDLKMVLNQALAEYYKSGLTKTDEFKQTILGIYSKVRSIVFYWIAVYCWKEFRMELNKIIPHAAGTYPGFFFRVSTWNQKWNLDESAR